MVVAACLPDSAEVALSALSAAAMPVAGGPASDNPSVNAAAPTRALNFATDT